MTDQLLIRYRRLFASTTTRTVNMIGTAWDRLGTYNEDDIARYAASVSPVLNGAKAATVASAVAFYGSRLSVPGISVNPAAVATAADLRTPFTAAWHALTQGRSYEEAIAAGRSAAIGEADRFLTSTARRTGDVFADNAGLTLSYERVAEPDACDWCRDRDGGVYDSAEAGDYGHDNCHCDVVPIA